MTASIARVWAAHPQTEGCQVMMTIGCPGEHAHLSLVPRSLSHLVRGGHEDPLLPHLQALVEQAHEVDIAVAFVMPTGMELVQPLLQRMLAGGGRLRVLCGDYLGITDPDALMRLCDLADGCADRVDLRVYRPQGQSFHPKAYLMVDRQGRSTGFVGSSNLSASALQGGLEWNYRLIPEEDARGLQELRRAFEGLFARGETLTASWVQDYRSRRTPPLMADGASSARRCWRSRPPAATATRPVWWC
jgi:HKD family nuclease